MTRQRGGKERPDPAAAAAAPAAEPAPTTQEEAGAEMEIHRPKAAHSWREFLIEIGTIVLGILIALGLEQSIEALRERHLAHEAQDAIDAEMRADLDLIASRLSRQACIERRLAQVAGLLVDWNGGKAPPAGLVLGDPGDAPLIDQRWQANLNSGRFSRQAALDQAKQADFYTRLRILNDVLQREHYAWSQLRTLELGPRLLSTDIRPALTEALQSARTDAHDFAQIARLQARISGRAPSTSGIASDAADLGDICRPLVAGLPE
ncbi:MAG TPA: hypothetical protein VKI45_00010 [Allosphingosinicella sp.]|nr:hypothetical protein [Allosphingosinicella sp.]